MDSYLLFKERQCVVLLIKVGKNVKAHVNDWKTCLGIFSPNNRNYTLNLKHIAYSRRQTKSSLNLPQNTRHFLSFLPAPQDQSFHTCFTPFGLIAPAQIQKQLLIASNIGSQMFLSEEQNCYSLIWNQLAWHTTCCLCNVRHSVVFIIGRHAMDHCYSI